jgi:LmbE family N-acetylglucosaminyl deacetylase
MNIDIIVNDIVKRKTPCFFFSPHLDDAILSAGSLMAYLASRTKVVLVTVFTECLPGPLTLSMRVHLARCGYHDADRLFADRRSEDIRVCRRIGVAPVHLGRVDALWRRRKRPGVLLSWLGSVLPEARYRYPVYRWSVVSGRVHPEDAGLTDSLVQALRVITRPTPEYVAFAPSGIGEHVDHLIVRQAAERACRSLVLWSDFPYSLSGREGFPFGSEELLPSETVSHMSSEKKELIRLYQTQAESMFPGGEIPTVPERFAVAKVGGVVPLVMPQTVGTEVVAVAALKT